MPLGVLRLGIMAWGGGGRAARALVLAVAVSLSLPVVLSLMILAAVTPAGAAAAGTVAAGAAGRPMASWVVTQPYGCTGLGLEPPRGACSHFHFGIDLAAPFGAAVAAVAPGRAEVMLPSGFGGGYGVHVLVHHGNGLETLYAHLSDVTVAGGDQVATGTVLGHEGSTGLSTGPHLHFEVREAGAAVDPISVFPGVFGPEGQPR